MSTSGIYESELWFECAFDIAAGAAFELVARHVDLFRVETLEVDETVKDSVGITAFYVGDCSQLPSGVTQKERVVLRCWTAQPRQELRIVCINTGTRAVRSRIKATGSAVSRERASSHGTL